MELEKSARAAPVTAARKRVRQIDAETIADMVELVQIPAPPFGEAERGQWIEERFRQIGLADICVDEVGNVLARLPHESPPIGAPPVLLAAHLDTVFSGDTPLHLHRNGKRIAAPGIADNARGLAALLAVAKVLVQCPVRTQHPIVFVATVGEEGVGDLRGVKHLLRTGSPWREAAGFITIDGTGRRRIVHRAIGSRRFSATVSGPGGHSGGLGLANPIHALGVAIGRLAQLDLPKQPRAALTVGRVGGGTSVNAIPESAWLEIDLRSEDVATLVQVEQQVREIVGSAVEEVSGQRRRGTPALRLEFRLIGDRPTGETPPTANRARCASSNSIDRRNG
jgi:acetylornithine deacetylase/succinyl-diaminopimelate desuccinylase-like protein